jgi:oligopeptide/dipeptide ABC transporter ATP-binding protein
VSLLEIDKVTHVYSKGDGKPVLRGVSLDVGTDELVALVGESGCGKTTLGKIAAGLIRPTTGEVRFDGRDIWSLDRRETKAWRPSVQLVHQDPYASLNPGLTIGTVLSAGLLRNRLVNRRDRRAVQDRMLSVLRQVGLDDTTDFLHRYPHQLSGGQRQRVAIARALSLEPRLIVADEVTSMLDVSMRVAILDLLLSLRGSHSVAYLFISHDFGVVRYFTQGGRVVVMFYGTVVEAGPTEAVIRRRSHPYTYLLLESLPVPDPTRAKRREKTQLSEPVAGPAGEGCVFSNRCPFAEDKCRESRPPPVDVEEGHQVACFFPERVPPAVFRREGGESRGKTGSPMVVGGGSGHADHVAAGPAGHTVEG